MKLLVNMSNNLGGGGLQVALSFVDECRSFPENEYHIVAGDAALEQIDRAKFAENFYFYPSGHRRFWQLSRLMRRMERQIRPDMIFTVFGPSYWRPRAPHLMGFANGYYLYPESPFWDIISPLENLKIRIKKRLHKWYIDRDADAVVCETTDATKRSSQLFDSDKKYFTVSNTCSSVYFNEAEQVDIRKLPQAEPNEFRLLTLSKYYRHKNLELIPEILDNLFARGVFSIKFVLTLHSEDYERLIGERYRKNVYNVGPTVVAECPALYRECDAMFLPTTLECFSASYLEAMAMRRPILTSDLSFAHAICRDAALYFDPVDTEQIADRVVELATDESLRDELILRGENRLEEFPTARQRAKEYLDICKNLKDV